MDTALQFLLACLWLAGVVGFVAFIVHQFKSNARERAEFKRKAVAQFTAWQSTHAASQLQLGSTQCEIVDESETVGRVRNGPIYSYTLTRFMRNPEGQYFMFKSTPTGPFVKLVAPEVARAVLKEKFVDHAVHNHSIER